MKSFISILYIISFSQIILAQDTLKVTTEMDTAFVPPQYVKNLGEYFMDEMPVKKAFKIGFSLSNNSFLFQSIRYLYTYEYKFNRCFSINAGIGAQLSYPVSSLKGTKEGEKKTYYGRSNTCLVLEPRWYFNKNKKVNNLNGTYIALKSDIDISFKGVKNELVFGIQKQILQKNFSMLRMQQYSPMFVDMSVGMGVEFYENSKPKPTFHYSVIYGGIASRLFGYSKKEADLPSFREQRNGNGFFYEKLKVNNMVRYFDNKQHILKIDLMHLFTAFNQNNYTPKASIAYEHTIGKSPFSVNAEVAYQLGKLENSKDDKGYLKSSAWQTSIESRYYYNAKKRSVLDESSNLSGVFAALQFGYMNQNTAEKLSTAVEEIERARNYLSLLAVFGIQTRLTKNVFVEMRVGAGARTPQYDAVKFFQKYEFVLLQDLKLGLAF